MMGGEKVEKARADDRLYARREQSSWILAMVCYVAGLAVWSDIVGKLAYWSRRATATATASHRGDAIHDIKVSEPANRMAVSCGLPNEPICVEPPSPQDT